MTTNPSDDDLRYCDNFTVSNENFCADFAWGRFTVDYDAGKIYADICSANKKNNPGSLIDHYEIPINGSPP